MANKEVTAKGGSNEGWITLKAFAEYIGGVSRTWLYDRMGEGMPYAIIAARRKVKIPDAASWLEKEGHINRSVE